MADNAWITNAGETKIVNALASTTPFNITKWKIGSTANVSLDQNLTDVVGTVLDNGTVSEMEFDVISADNIIIRVILDEAKGPYDVGNVGLFSDDDTLIAFGTFETARTKTPNAVGVVGNRLVLNVPINFVDVQSSINFTVYTNVFSSWPFVQTIADLPDPNLAPFEGYIVREDPTQNRPITAIRNEEPASSGNFVWTFDYHNLITGDANNNDNRIEIDTSTGEQRTYISGIERTTLKTDGKLGIAYNDPQQLLHVGSFSGDNAILIGSGPANAGRLVFNDANGSGHTGGLRYSHDSNSLVLVGTGADRLTLDTNGHFFPASNNTQNLGGDSNNFSEIHGATFSTGANRLLSSTSTTVEHAAATFWQQQSFYTNNVERLRLDTTSLQLLNGTQFLFDDGSVSFPAIAFASNTDTGFFLNGSELSASINNEEILRIVNDAVIVPDTTGPGRSIEVGQGRTTDGYALIDLIGDSTYTDYGLRLERTPGANGSSNLIHRGTGNFVVDSIETAGEIQFRHNSLNQVRMNPDTGVWIEKLGTSSQPVLRVINPLGTNSFGTVAEFTISDTGPVTNDKPAISFITNLGSVQTSWSAGFHYPDPTDNRRFSLMEGRNSTTSGTERFWVFTGTDGVGIGGFDLTLGSNDQITRGDSGSSRALVKNPGSKLIINFAGDFTGGTEVQSSLEVSGDIFAGNPSLSHSRITNSGTIELTNTGGTPLIDFKNSTVEDYDARIIRNSSGGLDFQTIADSSTINTIIDGDVITSVREATNNVGDANFRITDSVALVSSNYRLIDGYINGSEKFRIDHIGNMFIQGLFDTPGAIQGASINVGGSTVTDISNITKFYAGRVNSVGAAISLPSGWSSSQLGTGNYRVTHNLNTVDYTVVTTTIGSFSGGSVVTVINSNYFDVVTKDSSNNTAINLDWHFNLNVN